MASSPVHKELKADWKHEVEVKVFSKQEVATHSSRQNLWIILHGKGKSLVGDEFSTEGV